MIAAILSISLLIIGCSTSPIPPSDSPVKIGLSLDAINPGLVEIANQHIASLTESAAQKAAEINNLVETASKTLQPVYQTVSETLNSGINTVSDTASKTLQPVYQTVSDTFNTGLSTVSDTASSGFKAVSKTVTDGLTAVSGKVSDGITAVSSRVRDGIVNAKNVVEDQYEAAASAVNAQVEVVGSIASQAQTAATGISGNIASAVNEKTAAVGRLISIPDPGPFEDRPRKLENAILEQEDFLSSKQSIKDNIQGFVGGIFQPQPIVDNITEEEKYGNDGDQFASIGRALVGTTEGLTKFFSNAINIPFDAIKSITRSASDKLNNFGARLIGLK